jgi:hypothetical protein
MRRPSARRPSPKSSKNRKRLPPRQSSQQDKPNARPSTFSHAVARLAFDSEVDPGYVGCRTTETSAKRRLRFETEDSEIDLEMGRTRLCRAGALQVRSRWVPRTRGVAGYGS